MKRASARGSVLRSWERGISGIASRLSRCFREQYVFQRSCGLMEIEHLIRYTALAVGLKPSASQGEARLRGL
jgi:hypothetical protein